MSYKSLSVVLTDTESATFLCDAAATLADRWSAHLDVLCLGIHPVDPNMYGMDGMPGIERFTADEAATKASELKKLVEPQLERAGIAFTIRMVVAFPSTVGHAGATRMRFSDAAILPQPEGEGAHISTRLLEAAIFEAHIPVIVLPKGAEVGELASRVLVGWNDSDAALTAVRMAMPVMTDAEQVELAVIDPPEQGDDGFAPGEELAAALAHHGLSVDLAEIAKTEPRISDMLLHHATDTGATVLVFGAYGHSRMRQSMFGGTTRELLENAKLPLLIAH